MIAIVDYGAGNISSVKKALEHVDAETQLTSDPQVIASASKLVMPGVGHFCRCETLNRELGHAVLDSIHRGVPFLGICVGMQWLFTGSSESPETTGASLLEGLCERFPAEVKSPHVGWNRIELHHNSRLFRGIENGSFVYFTHSYRAPIVAQTIASSNYGGLFSSAIENENVFGVQFHPEKSGQTGLTIIENFCRL